MAAMSMSFSTSTASASTSIRGSSSAASAKASAASSNADSSSPPKGSGRPPVSRSLPDSVVCSAGLPASAMRLRPLLVDDLGVDDLVVVRRTGRPAARAAARFAGIGGRLLVQPLAELLAGGDEVLGRPADGLEVAAVEGLLQLLQAGLDALLLVATERLALLSQQLLGLVDERVRVVADLGLFLAPAVILGVGLGVADHPVDVVLVERGLTG